MFMCGMRYKPGVLCSLILFLKNACLSSTSNTSPPCPSHPVFHAISSMYQSSKSGKIYFQILYSNMVLLF